MCNHGCKNLVAQGRCPDGAACEYCHLPHDKGRLIHLDKKNRVILRDMDARSKVRLLWPLLQEKVEALAMGPRATQALLEWFWEVDAAFPSRAAQADMAFPCRAAQVKDPATMDSGERRLWKCLKSMSVVEICMTPGPGEGGPCLRQASQRLLNELRAASLVAER